MTDAEGRIVLVNREIERLFGYAREEVLGKTVDLLVPESFRDIHPQYRAGFTSAPKIRAMGAGRELYGRHKDGRQVPVEIGLTPVITEEGLFVLSSIVDISARKRAEARFQIAVESSPNGMVLVDADGHIVLVNRAVEQMFGFSRAELLGQPIEMLVPARFRHQHPVDRNRFQADPRERAMGEGRELFGLRKDGTELAVEIGLNPIETEEGRFVLSSIVDVSARKLAEQERHTLEEQLRQSQKLEAVGTLAGGIAHDFRNILNGIIGYAELVGASLRRQPGAGQSAGDIDELLGFAHRGRQLVERILAFSRRQEVKRLPLSLEAVVSEAACLLRATLPTSIMIDTAVGEDLPAVLADATSVHQVVMNLGTNAAQAMPHGGRLAIQVEAFYARDSFARANPDIHEGPYAVLTVRDSGHGIDPAVVNRVFEPFFTTKDPGAGTGLGLAMVHGIMKEHGGAVRLASELEKGTEVRCYFPALETHPAPAWVDVADPESGNGEHVLFVDDEPSLARIGARRLEGLNYRVTIATSGAEALTLLRADPAAFDLLITDFTMPGLDGLELATEITRIRPGLPVILSTGQIDDFPPEVVRPMGVHRVLLKPTTTTELARAAAEVLGDCRAS